MMLELPPVIDGVLHHLHAILDFFVHCNMHDHARYKTNIRDLNLGKHLKVDFVIFVPFLFSVRIWPRIRKDEHCERNLEEPDRHQLT